MQIQRVIALSSKCSGRVSAQEILTRQLIWTLTSKLTKIFCLGNLHREIELYTTVQENINSIIQLWVPIGKYVIFSKITINHLRFWNMPMGILSGETKSRTSSHHDVWIESWTRPVGISVSTGRVIIYPYQWIFVEKHSKYQHLRQTHDGQACPRLLPWILHQCMLLRNKLVDRCIVATETNEWWCCNWCNNHYGQATGQSQRTYM